MSVYTRLLHKEEEESPMVQWEFRQVCEKRNEVENVVVCLSTLTSFNFHARFVHQAHLFLPAHCFLSLFLCT